MSAYMSIFSPQLEKLIPETVEALHNRGENEKLLSVLEKAASSQSEVNHAIGRHIREARPVWFMRGIYRLFSKGVQTEARTRAAVLDVINQLKTAQEKHPFLSDKMGRTGLFHALNHYAPELSETLDMNDPSFLSVLTGKILSDLAGKTSGQDRCSFVGLMKVTSPEVKYTDAGLTFSGKVAVDNSYIPFVINDCNHDDFTLTYVGSSGTEIVRPVWDKFNEAKANYENFRNELQTSKDKLNAEGEKQRKYEQDAGNIFDRLREATHEYYLPSTASARSTDKNLVAHKLSDIQRVVNEYQKICDTVTEARSSVLTLTRATCDKAREVRDSADLMFRCAQQARNITQPVYDLSVNILGAGEVRRVFENEGVQFIEKIVDKQGHAILTRPMIQEYARNKTCLACVESNLSVMDAGHEYTYYKDLARGRKDSVELYSQHAKKVAELHSLSEKTEKDLNEGMSLLDEDMEVCSQKASLISAALGRALQAELTASNTVRCFAEGLITSDTEEHLLDKCVPTLVTCEKIHLMAIALSENIKGRIEGLTKRISDTRSMYDTYIQSVKNFLESLQRTDIARGDKVADFINAEDLDVNYTSSKIAERIIKKLEKAEALNTSGGSLAAIDEDLRKKLSGNVTILKVLSCGPDIPVSDMKPEVALMETFRPSQRKEMPALEVGGPGSSTYSRWDVPENDKFDARLEENARVFLKNRENYAAALVWASMEQPV